jgi:hypothetical protein
MPLCSIFDPFLISAIQRHQLIVVAILDPKNRSSGEVTISLPLKIQELQQVP